MVKNELISKVLKEYRRRNKISVKEVVSFLNDQSIFVAEKTVYGWENGQSIPDADTLMFLCTLYNIEDVLGTFGYREQQAMSITKQEEKLITQFRDHPEFHRTILKLLDLTPIDRTYFEYKK